MAFLHDVLVRLAVMLPATLGVTALVWGALKRFNLIRTDLPRDWRNMRTWPLSYALADAALFSVTFAAVTVASSDAPFAGAISAFTSIGLAPVLFSRLAR